ncbi:MAG TPA: hypothetical protein PLS24_03500 [Sedimentisphaerales bacterium]|nr:hypothetical protein [Sedimentisphaerales bacterium]
MPADELFRLGDLFSLLFVRPSGDEESFFFLSQIGREIARVGLDRAAVKLQGAIGYPIEEIPVMADDDYGRPVVGQEFFQPLCGVDVQMIGRLIEEHEVGFGEEELCQKESVLLPTAELVSRAMVISWAESKAFQHLLDLVIEMIGIESVQFLLEVIKPCGQPASFGRVLGMSEPGRCVFGLMLQIDEMLDGSAGFFPDRASRGKLGMLFQVTQFDAAGDQTLAAVARFSPCDNFEECGLARAVRPHQPCAVPGEDVKGDAIEDRLRPIKLSQTGNMQNMHKTFRVFRTRGGYFRIAGVFAKGRSRPIHCPITTSPRDHNPTIL